MNQDFFLKKRMELSKRLPENSLALVYSGHTAIASNDTEFPFEANRNFYYFTGLSQPGMFLVVYNFKTAGPEALFIPRANPNQEKWTGKMISQKECSLASGITDIRYVDEFDSALKTLVARGIESIYLYFEPLEPYQGIPAENQIAAAVSERFPGLALCSLAKITNPLRAVKSPEEVEVMRIASRITKQAFEESVKHIRPGIREYEVQAAFEYVVKRHGGRIAFNSIVAAGENATSLHYTANQSRIEASDLILMDCGASYEWYNSDVTRTFPANGTFTEKQLEIYNIVLEANQTIIKAVKPGVTLSQLNAQLIAFYKRELQAKGLISSEEEVSEYYYHGVSHSLGLDVHDVFDRDAKLEQGMVVTVEPGLYFEKYKIGVRIEDDVLVTANGCTVLTADIVKNPAEIEELMNVWEVK
ncbi:MAG: aminopeptidase P family protein [Eubacteriaceae bacterium]|jgi:Xaa-Pro aminopeptidase|nr:aminopeptidase P family protein [Eubacteriaceae bacterium]